VLGSRGVLRVACLLTLVAALLGCALPQTAGAELEMSTGPGVSTEPEAGGEQVSLTPSSTEPYTLCPPGGPMIVECDVAVEPPAVATPSGYRPADGGPLLGGEGSEGGWDAANLQSAYNIPTSGGSGETVAIVDAYGYNEAQSDLATYRKDNGLAECTEKNECFQKVNEKGENKNYPASEGELEHKWSLEQAIDLDMVSTACPNCKILLVEATTQSAADTAASVEEAVTLKATEISNSYGYPESDEEKEYCPAKKGCKEYLAAYDDPGIPVTVAAGDSGYDDHLSGWGSSNWPATSPNVIAVGGTALTKVEKTEAPRGWKERVWLDSGSGCSLYELAPPWQEAEAFPRACGTYRTDNDVAAVATNVSVYNTPTTPEKKENEHWVNVIGTSVATPLIAGIEAHANSVTKKLGADAFYRKPSMLFHISEGSDGSCGAVGSETYYLCNGTPGKETYNGPTGWGTPDGVFSAGPNVVTEAATGVAKTGATLTGTVNPNGEETKYYFEYGTSTSYGTKTGETSAGAGTSKVKASKAITGLTPATQYDFRMVATNSSKETSEGRNEVFSTLPNAPVNTVAPVISPVTPDRAVPASTTAGTWTNSPTSYTYEWERCTASGGECKEITGASSATYTPVAEDVGHALLVKVTATNSGGSSSALSAATNEVQPIGRITEHSLPSGSGPEGITAGPDGNLWFTDRSTSKIGKITTSGTVTEYSFESESEPFGITAGPDGNVWFTAYGRGSIGKITTSGSSTTYAVPTGSGPRGIAAGPDGNLWFTDFYTSKISKLTTSGTRTEYSLPAESYPEEIAAGPDGNLWFTDFETSKIGKITTSGTITEYSLPKGSRPGGITAGPDGNLWFVDSSSGMVGKITTSGTITEYALPSGSEPEQIAAGADGNLWFTEFSRHKIGSITTSGTITEYALPSESKPVGIASGPDENVWFAEWGTSKIGTITP
jgi:streptogramin lyase